MAVIFFNGGYEDEQAKGGDTINSFMRGYIIRRDDPLNMIFIGGHEISDAPTYNETEGLMIPRRVNINGRNVVREETITSDYVKSIELNLNLPNRAVSVTDRVYQSQKNCDYDIVFVPTTCDFGCNRYALLGEDITLGVKKLANGILGWDDNEQPIEWTRTLKITGNLKQYNGLEVVNLAAAAQDLHAAYVVDDNSGSCQGCDCPYQTMYRGGAANLLQVSTDGGVTWTAVNTAALPAAHIITSIVSLNNRIIFSYADVANAIAVTGGVAYINAAGVAVLSTLEDDGAAFVSDGVQDLVVAGNKVYSFGTAGEIMVSCDGGFTFEYVNQTEITDTILDADYDAVSQVMWIGTVTGGVFSWDFQSFVDYTAAVSSAFDITAVRVLTENQVAVYDANGDIYENWNVSGGADWVQTAALGNDIFGVGLDKRNYRSVVASGATIFVRELSNLLQFEPVTTLANAIFASYTPAPLEDEANNFFLFVGDAGQTTIVRQCGICLSGGCG